jgi:hypothetical protein
LAEINKLKQDVNQYIDELSLFHTPDEVRAIILPHSSATQIPNVTNPTPPDPSMNTFTPIQTGPISNYENNTNSLNTYHQTIEEETFNDVSLSANPANSMTFVQGTLQHPTTFDYGNDLYYTNPNDPYQPNAAATSFHVPFSTDSSASVEIADTSQYEHNKYQPSINTVAISQQYYHQWPTPSTGQVNSQNPPAALGEADEGWGAT